MESFDYSYLENIAKNLKVEDVPKLSDDELFYVLNNYYSRNIGPVGSSTRSLYVKLLMSIINGEQFHDDSFDKEELDDEEQSRNTDLFDESLGKSMTFSELERPFESSFESSHLSSTQLSEKYRYNTPLERFKSSQKSLKNQESSFFIKTVLISVLVVIVSLIIGFIIQDHW